MEFFSEIMRARTLLEQGQIESSIELLSAIRTDYRRGSYFVDLLGDAFLSKGDVQEGVRYKTLFEILTKILDAIDHGSVAPEPKIYEQAPSFHQTPFMHPFQTSAVLSVAQDDATSEAEESRLASPEIMPVTLAIGKQYLAQGHFDLAISVFQKLMEQNPLDPELHDLLTKAKAHKRREAALNVLQRWLSNVEKLKIERKTLT